MDFIYDDAAKVKNTCKRFWKKEEVQNTFEDLEESKSEEEFI